MPLSLRILDRYMLRAALPALAAATLALAGLWFVEGPIPASTGGAYALAVALYRDLVAPRRAP